LSQAWSWNCALRRHEQVKKHEKEIIEQQILKSRMIALFIGVFS
jgi:hypothetical protein